MVRVAATGVPLSCTLPSQPGSMRRRAADTATRAEVHSSVFSSPTAESAPPSVIHAESQSPTCRTRDASGCRQVYGWRSARGQENARGARVARHVVRSDACKVAVCPLAPLVLAVVLVQRECDAKRQDIHQAHKRDRHYLTPHARCRAQGRATRRLGGGGQPEGRAQREGCDAGAIGERRGPWRAGSPARGRVLQRRATRQHHSRMCSTASRLKRCPTGRAAR